MNKGVEILIERMKTNPEDFSPDGKFADTARRIREGITGEDAGKMPWFTRHLLTDAEWEALKTAFIEMSRDAFTQKVMKNLLKEQEEPKKEMYSYVSPNLGLSTGTAGYTTMSNTANSKVTIAPYHNGPSIDFNKENIDTLNEMIAAWRGEDGTI